ncbi:MAG: hypothetical protein KGO49_11330 [Gammaproteobacteria bacterium]|nr:hypothetical protein [Gammaproteobacteria bacterium]
MRINTHLHVSRTKVWAEGVLLLIVVSVLLFSGMPTLIIALTLMAMICVLISQKFLQKSPAHLVQLIQFDQQDWRWSVYDPRRIKKTSVQEGRLLSVHHWFFVLLMRFETTDKHKNTIQSWVIWRDQVDVDQWRRLVVIARFWASDTQQINS